MLRSSRGAIRSVPGPVPDATIVAPVFDGPDVVAVVSAAPTRAVPEDEWSNDLWRYRSDRKRWVRLTAFSAGADRWTAIRTPFATPDGSIEFVVVRGRASQTRMPHFSLWRLRGTGSRGSPRFRTSDTSRASTERARGCGTCPTARTPAG